MHYRQNPLDSTGMDHDLSFPTSIHCDFPGMERRLLHRFLALPLDRPYFRRGTAHLFPSDIPASAPLINVHEGLVPTGKM
jgi:hypothetical protein